MRYQDAQQEIYRAQDVLRTVDQQLHKAENEAAEARAQARRLGQEIMLKTAMEEGRQAGLREGLKRGRELALQDAQIMEQYDELDEEEGYDSGGRLDDNAYRPRSRFITSAEDVQTPVSPEVAQPPLAPVPAVSDPPPDRPRSVRNPSPSIGHLRLDIPPDGYIPALGADHIIRIPPPHEFSRPPPTPERTPVLRLSRVLERDQSGSASGMLSPLSARSEARTIPNSAHNLRRQASWVCASMAQHFI